MYAWQNALQHAAGDLVTSLTHNNAFLSDAQIRPSLQDYM